MSKLIPAIPDPTNDPDAMFQTVIALKEAVEQLAGIRAGNCAGAPRVFLAGTAPSNPSQLKAGDFWIDNVNGFKLYIWDGKLWYKTA